MLYQFTHELFPVRCLEHGVWNRQGMLVCSRCETPMAMRCRQNGQSFLYVFVAYRRFRPVLENRYLRDSPQNAPGQRAEDA
ncbi:MAG: hypothetical protein LIO46_06980 [Clostridiales bacterium]|nr:hypothetical protein [Clostridiales bacterium]